MLHWIDALRGLAILMVLANHVALAVPGVSAPLEALARFGQMGVQLFFVVSAYTLCLSWHERRDEPQPVLRFLLRRVFRIAPLYWAALAGFAALHLMQGDGPGPYTAPNVTANLLLVHGLVESANNGLVPGGWSIGTEIAFYAMFPALMAAAARWPGAGRAAVWAAAALAASLALAAWRGAPVANNSFAYFHLANQLPVFLIGVALFQFDRRRGTRRATSGAVALALGSLALTALLWRSHLDLAFALVPASAALAFAGIACAARRVDLRCAPLEALGRASYAIYIVHTLFAWHAVKAVSSQWPLQGDGAYLAALGASTLLSYVAARWLQRSVERPGIELGRRLVHALPAGRVSAAR